MAAPFRKRTAQSCANSPARATANEGQELMLNHLASMTPDARAAFADNLEKNLSRRKPR